MNNGKCLSSQARLDVKIKAKNFVALMEMLMQAVIIQTRSKGLSTFSFKVLQWQRFKKYFIIWNVENLNFFVEQTQICLK